MLFVGFLLSAGVMVTVFIGHYAASSRPQVVQLGRIFGSTAE